MLDARCPIALRCPSARRVAILCIWGRHKASDYCNRKYYGPLAKNPGLLLLLVSYKTLARSAHGSPTVLAP